MNKIVFCFLLLFSMLKGYGADTLLIVFDNKDINQKFIYEKKYCNLVNVDTGRICYQINSYSFAFNADSNNLYEQYQFSFNNVEIFDSGLYQSTIGLKNIDLLNELNVLYNSIENKNSRRAKNIFQNITALKKKIDIPEPLKIDLDSIKNSSDRIYVLSDIKKQHQLITLQEKIKTSIVYLINISTKSCKKLYALQVDAVLLSPVNGKNHRF
ncbi:MAG: hypothetical protein WKF35_12760 [Ferruginibacter sp.]